MQIEKIIQEIIPPIDYHHRNGFNNIPLIDKLNKEEKVQLEDALLQKLLFESAEKKIDTLIVETLSYLKSYKSLSILNKLLEKCSDDMVKLVIATSIFDINKDEEMINVAINIIREIDDKKGVYYVHNLTSSFYYLIKFKNSKLNSIIEEYAKHKEYLIAYNARNALKSL